MVAGARWITLGAVLAASAVLMWHLRTRFEVSVATAPVTVGPIMREVVAAGTVQAEASVQVGAQVSGVVQALNVDFNSLVHRGDVIARLDPSQYDEQLKQARAAKEQAEADVAVFRSDVEDARQKLSRMPLQAASHFVTRGDLESARAAFDESQASLHAGEAALRRADAAVAQATVNLQHTIIRAPSAGVVIDRQVDIGQTVAASVGAPVLFTIASDLDTVQLQVEVENSDVGWIEAGDGAVFSVDAFPHEIYHGTVSQIRSGDGSCTAILDVPNPADHLLPGMTAVVTIDGAHRSHAVRMPNAALVFSPTPEVLESLGASPAAVAVGRQDVDRRQIKEVWKYDGQHLSPVFVRPGLADDQWTEVVSGSLAAGDRLATSATVSERRPRLWSGL